MLSQFSSKGSTKKSQASFWFQRELDMYVELKSDNKDMIV